MSRVEIVALAVLLLGIIAGSLPDSWEDDLDDEDPADELDRVGGVPYMAGVIHDWRPSAPKFSRAVDDMRPEMIGARILDISENGNEVLLELSSGERIWFGASGWEYDMGIRPWRA